MRLAFALLLAGCAGASARPPSCAAPADQVEVAQIQIGWNAVTSGRPSDPPVIDQRVAGTRYEADAERLARDLLTKCEKGEPLAPLQQQYSEVGPGTQVLDASSNAPFRSAALCLKKGECMVFHSDVAWHVLRRVN